jgi:hypothetical protein
VTAVRNITGPDDDLAGDIGRAVLASLQPPRRPRVCPRRVKSPLSSETSTRPAKTRTSKKITTVTTKISRDHQTAETHREKSVTTPLDPKSLQKNNP